MISPLAPAQEAPWQPDENTVLLLHLDGDARDASGRGNHGKTRGPAQWADGRFGRAVQLEGSGGIEMRGSSTLYVGENSWTAELWFKPDRKQPKHAYMLSGGWGHQRDYAIRISEQRLVARFSNGVNGGQLVAPGVAKSLFDGNWHHVAVVLDRERGGEVRLYLDGQRIMGREPLFCPPIYFDNEAMGVVLGGSSPWTLGKQSGYQGLIDEVRISNIVRPEFASDAPLPTAAKTAVPLPPPAFMPGPEDSQEPLSLAPEQTVIVLPEQYVGEGNFAAARELQTRLRQAYGVKQGFATTPEAKVGRIEGKTVIALGRTRWVSDEEIAGLSDVGYILRRKGNVVVIAGAKTEGSYYGALRLLDLALGVRFYMPTPLFTSAPRQNPTVPGGLDLRVDPFVESASMSGILSIPGDDGWAKRNAVNRRLGGTHQHNMYAVFPPERYAKAHPEIYPIIKGERYIPEGPGDQKWQPNLSEPALVDVAVASTKQYFQQHPNDRYLSFVVQDSHVICQCDRCQRVYAKYKGKAKDARQAQAMGFSELYWQFIKNLALRVQKEVPGKLIVAMVYGPARYPPTFELPENVILFTNYHIAELEADKILTPIAKTNASKLDRVLDRSTYYGNHDWYHGRGFLLPRIYSGYWSQFMQALRSKARGAFMHAEAYPNWGLDGPKYYILGRLWWDSDVDVDALLRQFCDDMFGSASDAMYAYFTTLEALWATLDNVKGPERKLYHWESQFKADADDLAQVRRCRDLLNKALSDAETADQKQRIQLFSDTFVVPERLFAFASAKTIDRAAYEAFEAHVERKILPNPMTLYGAGKDATRLQNQISAALKQVTQDGKKVR